MPQIEVYSPPSSGQVELHPADFGERSTVQMARNTRVEAEQAGARVKAGVGEIAQAAGNIVKQYQHTDITQGMSRFATTINSLHDAATAFMKDPNLDLSDPNLMQKFMDQHYEPAMDAVRSGINTQAGMDAFNEHYNEYTTHFRQQFQTDLSTIAGIHNDAGIENYMAQTSNLIQKNPSALGPALATIDSTMRAMVSSNPNISAPDQQKSLDKYGRAARQQFEESALYSVMRTNTGAAQALLDSGELKDVDGMKANMALKQMRSIDLQNAAAGRAITEFNERQANDHAMAQTVEHIGVLAQQARAGDSDALAKLRDLSTNILVEGPKMGMKGTSAYQSSQMALDTLHHIASRSDVITDQGTLSTVNQQITDPNGPQIGVDDIISLKRAGKLSEADANDAVRDIQTIKSDPSVLSSFQEFHKDVLQFQPLIANANPTSALGAEGLGISRSREFENDHFKMFKDGLGKGLSAQDMLDATSKNYIFKDLQDYMVTPAQEQTQFGKSFTLGEPGAPMVPTSVRLMEAFRANHQAEQDAADRKAKMNAITGVKIEAPAPNRLGTPFAIPQVSPP